MEVNRYTLLLDSCKHGNLKLVRGLLLEYPDVVKDITANNNCALQWAANNGHEEIVKLLLEYPEVAKNIAADNNCALRYAADNGHLEVVRVLLEYPEVAKNITANNNCALRWAADNGHLEVVRLLEDKIREVSKSEYNRLNNSILEISKVQKL